MGQIYKEQARVDRTPAPLDVSTMELFDNKRRAAIEKGQTSTDFLLKTQIQEQQSIADQTETAALQVYKNGFSLYGNDQAKYTEFVSTNLEKIYGELPDSQIKRSSMAKVSMTGSGYNARVEKNTMDQKEAVAKESFKKNTFTAIESSKAGLSSLFAAQDQNLSPVQRVDQIKAFQDAQVPLKNAFDNRYAQDSNGNFIYSAPERAMIEDSWESRGSYALLDYASDNIVNNREGVVALRNGILENKADVQERYGISDEKFASTLAGMDKIIKGQTTSADLAKVQGSQLVNRETVKDMEIQTDGTVDNNEYDNIDNLVEVWGQLKASESAGVYTSATERKALGKEQGAVSRAIIKQVEDGVELTHKRNWFQKATKQAPNIGEVAVMEVNENIDKLENSMIFNNLSKDEKDNIKASMYVEVLGGLQQAEGITLSESDNPQASKVAQKIALGTYYKQVEGIVGSKPFVSTPDDPQSVKMAYDNALMQHDNEVSLNNIRQRLGAK